MLPTEREILAYDIRRDAEYTRRRLAERSAPDSPTLPTILGAAQHFGLWCDAASDELVANASTNVADVREAWRREAVASDIRFIPYGDLAALVAVGFGSMTLVFTFSALVGFGASAWIVVAVSGLLAVGAIAYRLRTPSRLAVGPDASHSTLAAASARDLLQSQSSTHQPRRYTPKRRPRSAANHGHFGNETR